MIFVRDRKEYGKRSSKDAASQPCRGAGAIKRGEDQGEEYRELSKVPAFHDDEPDDTPKHDEPAQAGFTAKNVFAEEGKQVMRKHDGMGRGGNHRTPTNCEETESRYWFHVIKVSSARPFATLRPITQMTPPRPSPA